MSRHSRGALAAAAVVVLVAVAVLAVPVTVADGKVSCSLGSVNETIPRTAPRDTGQPNLDQAYNTAANRRAGALTPCASAARSRIRTVVVGGVLALGLIGVGFWFVASDRRSRRSVTA